MFFLFEQGNFLLFFLLEKLNKTYKYFMSFPQTFPERVCICIETKHREVATSDGLETVHIAIVEKLDKGKEDFHWFKWRE